VQRHSKSKNEIIVEIGSGLGVDAFEIASHGFSVVSLDISKEALKQQIAKADGKGLNIIPVVADALHLPFKTNSISFFYHQGVAEHFSNPKPFLSEQYQALKPGGFLLIDVPQTLTFYTLKKKWAIYRHKWFAGWETQYAPYGLRRLVKSLGLKVIECYGREYDILPLIWLRDIETLGKTRFGHPIVPKPLRRLIGSTWRYWESFELSNYLKLCIGIVARKDENRD
jgi:SAM-dependent methyltransferase